MPYLFWGLISLNALVFGFSTLYQNEKNQNQTTYHAESKVLSESASLSSEMQKNH